MDRLPGGPTASGLMVMLREACSEKESNLERQTEESTDNQVNVYAVRADQTPREERRGAEGEQMRSTGAGGRTGAVALLLVV